MASVDADGITDFFSRVIKKYDTVRGKSIQSVTTEPFWDAVVITTADEDQSWIYRTQIDQKMERGELPLGLPFHVVSDPMGPKIGNGGSTFTALSYLEDKYGSKLYSLRILLIHAGGQSQRMPSASVLGKIFSPVPLGDPIYQMLDIKLAMYWPLIPKMQPGIFVACADDFVIYNLGADFEKSEMEYFAPTGFTALAHPSTLRTGTSHGVYVVKDSEAVNTQMHVQTCECLEVLQKPSEETMHRKGAVLKSKKTFPDGIQVSGSIAYTDSSFYFSHDVTKKMIDYFKENGPLTCEIDAYGDFLQALGPRATNDYIHNTSNVSTLTQDLLKTREQIFNLFQGTDLKLLIMNASEFVHIGTTKEYIHYFCGSSRFQQALGISTDVFNLWTGWGGRGAVGGGRGTGDSSDSGSLAKKMKYSDTALGCVMHSVLPAESFVSATAVLEYCHFSHPVEVGQNTILSNCKYEGGTVKVIAESQVEANSNSAKLGPQPDRPLQIPNNVFIHTIPVKREGSSQYVTVFFGIQDNLKKVSPTAEVHQLPFLGRTVQDYADVLDVNPARCSPQGSDQGVKVNLWHSNLFPVMQSASQSFLTTLNLINCVKMDKKRNTGQNDLTLVSMATVLKEKDVVTMLEHRNAIFDLITSKC